MTGQLKLSELVEQIQETIQNEFEGNSYWVSAQITNVKKDDRNRRCYLTLEEYEDGRKTAEMRSVFWSNTYGEIENFERLTKQQFVNGIEIICRVKVRFHSIYGLNLDVVQIDVAHTLGSLEIERQQTLERLVKENPQTIKLIEGRYFTYNNALPLPLVISNVALITAPNSDGQRDFLQELTKNKHDYTFAVTEFLTTIQGNDAHKLILAQLQQIEKSDTKFDVVAIVRGGGSQTDFKPFDEYELAAYVANFSTPIFTGIGHDRNQSIVDLMARELKTPTKVAANIVEHNFDFENALIALRNRLYTHAARQLQSAKDRLTNAKRIVKLSSPQAILNRGFAIVTSNNKILTNANDIEVNSEIQTQLRNEIIYSTVTKKTTNDSTNL